MSVAELSKKSGVSQATIARFAQNLSVDGFKDLKMELTRCSVDDVTNGLYDEISPNDNVDGLKDKLLIRIQHTLEATSQELDKKFYNKPLICLIVLMQFQFMVWRLQIYLVEICVDEERS